MHFVISDYADYIKVNIIGNLWKWQLYCCFNSGMLGDCKSGVWKVAMINISWRALMETFDWRSPMKKVDRAVSISFLYWICDNYRIKSWGTSWEYFRHFKQLYASVVGRYMDRNASKEVLKVHSPTSAISSLSVASLLTSLQVSRLVPGSSLQTPATKHGRKAGGRFR